MVDRDGTLAFKESPDFELPADMDRNNVYVVTVEAWDGRLSGILHVSVTVTNEDEPGRVALSSPQPQVETDDYFAPAVGWMLTHGITVGCDDDSFSPHAPTAGKPTKASAGIVVHDVLLCPYQGVARALHFVIHDMLCV